MSLRLWLPLNGTLENKGSDTVTITNNNATIDNSGKIGQCYSFNNSDSMIKIEGDLVSSMKSKTSFTISFWLYSNDSGNRSIYFATNTGTVNVYGFALEKTTGELLRFYWQGSPDLNLSTFTIPNQEWVHIACVYKNDNVYLYKNGVLTASKTDGSIKISALTNTWSYASLGRDYRTGNTTLNGKLNDFRWYDNALSEKEIKEIAKGLVLHLPLNNNGLGNKNILFNSKESFNVVPAANVNVTARSLIEDNTCPIDGKVASFTIGANGTTSSGCYYSMTQMGINPASSYLTSSATYTLSFYGKASVTAYLRAASLVESQTLIKYTPTSDKGAFIKLTSNWQKYTITFQWTSTSKMTVCFYADTNASEVTFNIAGLKLEEGSEATPYSPNPADEDYPASGSGIPENLFIATDMSESITTGGSTDWTKHFRLYNGSASIHTIDTTEMTDTIALTTANSNLGIAFARLNSEINLDPNEYYTISCEAKCTNADLKLCIGLSYYNDQSTWVWRGGSNAKSFTTADTWQKITHTFKPDANTYAICYCFTINPGASPTGTDTFSIRKCKLEKGSTATEWQPSPVDDSYKTLGYYNNIEHDTSGYCYNAVKHGILSYSSDAPKYNVSATDFTTTNYIKADPLPAETKTISVWAKTTKNKSYAQCILGDSSSALCLFIYGGGLVTYFRSTTGGEGSRVTFGDEYKENDWNHFVVVKTGDTTRNVYCNGVKLVNAANNYYGHATGFWVGARNINGQLPFYGYISDVRAYVTALSEKDILSLYNNNAYIDSNGKIYGKIR